MALDPAAQTVWADKLELEFRDAHLFQMGTNKDYEGDVRFNEAVKILTPARPTSSAYVRDTTTITYERLTPGEQVFAPDQRTHFGIKVDSLEKHLAKNGGKLWEEELRGGAWEMQDDIDDYIRDLMIAGVASANVLNARTLGVGAMTSNAYDLVVEFETTLKNAKVPPGGWHLFVPPEFSGLIARDDRFTGFNTPAARTTIRGGLETQIRGFTYHETTNSSVSGSNYTIIACSERGTTFAEQMSRLRFIEKTAGDFDERADSEVVYGGKVVRPDAIATCVVQFAS